MNTNDRIGHIPLILSDQVDPKESANMLVRSQKLQRLDYFDFASENFSLVRYGSEENYPETVFFQSRDFIHRFLAHCCSEFT